jgi:hypothetical protein
MVRLLRIWPLMSIFGRRETASVVQFWLVARRERVTDEGRAAGEKKHDEA